MVELVGNGEGSPELLLRILSPLFLDEAPTLDAKTFVRLLDLLKPMFALEVFLTGAVGVEER